MKLFSTKIVTASIVMGILPLLFMFPCFGASILDVYPVGTGLTTNTIMLINLDSPVAMIGNQPDITYCVKKNVSFSISGFDYTITSTDVACDVAASDDRKSVMLYPQALLDTDSSYAYRIENINFQGGGSAGNFTQCYATGNNPLIPLANSSTEAALCNDYNYEGGFNGISGGNFCFKCHVGGYTTLLPWDVGNYPIPTCTP
jgi:hypothetical protein